MKQVNEIWMIRHAKAGVENDYDCLAQQGLVQAKALGSYLRQMHIHFDAAFSGSLQRQKETLATVLDHLPDAPRDQVEIRESFNEFPPGQLLRVAAKLRESSEEFRNSYERWQNEWNNSVEAGKPFFFKVMRQFLEYWACESGEHGFQSWAASVLEGFSALPGHGRLLVVSSATPIALAAGAAFGMSPVASLKLLQHIYNSSITIVRRLNHGFASDILEPVMFNAVPHLRDPSMLTLL